MKKFLTIGIPTYNRRKAVVSNVRYMTEAKLPESVGVIIQDNCSDDGTYESLLAQTKGASNFRVVKNERNVGFQGNVYKLFEGCDTEYLMIMSDEDSVVLENLSEYLEFLRNELPALANPLKNTSLTSKMNLDSKVVKQEKKIECGQYHTFNILSGCTFNVSVAKEYIEYLKSNFEDNTFVFYYPHVAIASMVLRDGGKAIAFGRLLSDKKFQLDTQIVSTENEKFYFVSPRWNQIKGLYDFFEELKNEEDVRSIKYLRLNIMQEAGCMRAFELFRKGLAFEKPDLIPLFDDSARSYFYNMMLKSPLPEFIKLILFAFRKIFRAIKQRLPSIE